ncbi:AAA family ATPase [Halocatena marina]|uniref:AAA family ATPase n=1 Tax=Halocatena marina TaxID=2934937 RepID=A0ABD5YLS9_9EURY|nr:MoxR family ATPase [Halocatena marina]
MNETDRQHSFSAFSETELRELFESTDYVAEDDIVTTVLLALRLDKPLLIEGEPGSGKTELGKVLATGFDTELIRLQCYEGLTAENTLYEWNYTKQLLSIQAGEQGVAEELESTSDVETIDVHEDGSEDTDENGDEPSTVFSEEYLLERPLLRAVSAEHPPPPVLLIDEIDRADEEFEALLLEVLSDMQVTIPELGTVRATVPPIVIITSNRTRGLSDALKRRCLYLHVEPPSYEKERAIVRQKVPELDGAVATEVCAMTQRLREEPFLKQPGVAETLDWARAVAELRQDGDGPLSLSTVENTLGCLLKEVEDIQRVDDSLLSALLESASDARAEG